jgi:predicted nucleic acid-binding protein
MPYFTYDTSVIIARRVPILQNMPQNFLMSAVVLMELAASAHDVSQRKKFEQPMSITKETIYSLCQARMIGFSPPRSSSF